MASFELRGGREMRQRLERMARRFPDTMKMALRTEAELIMARSKAEFVPVDLGVLRASGHVQQPVKKGGAVEVTLAYGGAAEAYALIQHERLDFQHRVGQAKYLERPMMDAMPGMGERIGARVSAHLNLGAKG